MSLTHKGMGFFAPQYSSQQIYACLLMAKNSGAGSGSYQVQIISQASSTTGYMNAYTINNPYYSANDNVQISYYDPSQNYIVINDNGSYQTLYLTQWLSNEPYNYDSSASLYTINSSSTVLSNTINYSFPSATTYQYMIFIVFNGSAIPSANQIYWLIENWTGTGNTPYAQNNTSTILTKQLLGYAYIPIP